MPKVTEHANSIAVPLFTDEGGVFRTGLISGGVTVQQSLYWRGQRQRYRAAHPNTIAAQHVFETNVIYAGHIIDQFGHFILDSTARLWFAKEHPEIPIIWLSGNGYKPYQSEILDLLGIKNTPIFVTEPTQFSNVFLPETGFLQHGTYPDYFDRFLAKFEPSDIVSGRKAWVSRSNLPSFRACVLGEDEMEAQLSKIGWSIFHPEMFSVTEQLKFMSSCEVLAGWSGSAFHTLCLLKEVNPKVHIFARGTYMGKMFEDIAAVKKIDQTNYVLPLEIKSGDSSKASAVYTASMNSVVLQTLSQI
jgi:capsular polysaccharide biosynthesis protein